MHRGGRPTLSDIDWVEWRWDQTQAYSESKLYVTALALAVARLWPDVLSNAVDPGWVPTKMGGAGATDDLDEGYLTQTWLAVSDDPAVAVSGAYWFHRQREAPAAEVSVISFQDQLVGALAKLTGVSIFEVFRLSRTHYPSGRFARLQGVDVSASPGEVCVHWLVI